MQKKSGFSVSCYFLSIAIIFVTSRYRVTFSKDVSQYLQQHNLFGPQSGFYSSTTGPQLPANRLLTKNPCNNHKGYYGLFFNTSVESYTLIYSINV